MLNFVPLLLIQRWRRIALVTLGGTTLTIGVLLLLPRKFDAAVTVASVASRSGLSGAGLAASFLGTQALGGLQSTPAFLTRLVRLDGVLMKVANEGVDSGASVRLIDSLMEKPAGAVSPGRALRKMRRLVSVSSDLQTGLVTLRVTHTDSALARRTVSALLRTSEAAFVHATRAQASMLRRAQDLRVDSAYRRLVTAEERLRAFLASNRVVAPFSEAALTRQRLERELRLAETVHGQAVSDRESAVAKELEETPALVVVDALPVRLEYARRGLALRAILIALTLFVGTLGLLVAGERLRLQVDAGDPEAMALWRGLRGDVWLRWTRPAPSSGSTL